MRNNINLLREFSVPLIAGVIMALTWANLAPEGYSAFVYDRFLRQLSFHFVANELFMVFFFGIAAVEITKSCLPGGDLSPLYKAVNPLLATLGGAIGPVAVYFTLNYLAGSSALNKGWGIVTATDIALAWLVARLIFGKNHPVIAFLLFLAVADDAIGLAIIAIFYPGHSLPVEPVWLLLTAGGMALAYILNRSGCKNYWPYISLGGVSSWVGLHQAHLHPALALVFIVPFMPHQVKKTRELFEEDLTDLSTLARFEHEWKIIVDLGLFMFGVANAGVEFTAVGTVTWLVFIALLSGKTVGILFMGWLGERLGFPLPDGMRYKELAVVGVLSGIGFTVALFVAGEAFTDPLIAGAAKMGAILSILAAFVAVVLGKLLNVSKVC